MSFINRSGLLVQLRAQFAIDWWGHHGIAHWARVRANGLLLAHDTAANVHVVELFAFFHDAGRINEHVDDDHGARGAKLAWQWRDEFFSASNQEMAQLSDACERHSDGFIADADTTVMTCWDADRLDLGRVGITPDSAYLCTATARQLSVMQKSQARAQRWRDAFHARQSD